MTNILVILHMYALLFCWELWLFELFIEANEIINQTGYIKKFSDAVRYKNIKQNINRQWNGSNLLIKFVYLAYVNSNSSLN